MSQARKITTHRSAPEVWISSLPEVHVVSSGGVREVHKARDLLRDTFFWGELVGFRGSKVHMWTADDNVHVQNTYEMTSALVRANKQFDLFVYPDKNHGIYGKNTRYHLYKKITNFILENL